MGKKLNSYFLFIIFLLTFLGFYVIVLFLLNNDMKETTRAVTIPIRIVIGVSLLLLTIMNLSRFAVQPVLKWFLLFSGFFLARIIVDDARAEYYYLTTSDVTFYFFSFAVIPLTSLSGYRFQSRDFEFIMKAMLLSGFVFSWAAISFYGTFLGTVERLSSTSSTEIISPLILSYCSTLIIGVFSAYLLYNKTGKWVKIIAGISIVLATVPFFLGASRGSLFALFFPYLFILFANKSAAHTIRGIFVMIIAFVLLVFLAENFGSGLFERLAGTASDSNYSESAIRLSIWEESLTQFMDHPFFGDKLRVNSWMNYPHNLFIEVLQTTGIVGFIPFTIIVVKAFRIAIATFRTDKQYAWVPIIFVQAFMQNMFSGSIATAAWFWTSVGLILGFDLYRKSERRRNETAAYAEDEITAS